MNALVLLSEIEYFKKAENKLCDLFSSLNSPESNQLSIIEDIIKASVFSEKIAFTQFTEVTSVINKTITKNQKRVSSVLSSVDKILTENEYLALISGESKLLLKLKSPQDILLNLDPKAKEKFGYFSKLAFILRNENFVFLQVLLSLKENK